MLLMKPSDGEAGATRLGTGVELRNLKLAYDGGARAVDDVSLAIGPGEFVCLLGPSGSGKTTTLKMIAGFEHPDEGEIFVDGRPMVDVAAARRNIGMVFQNYALFPHMTVFDNVAFPLKMRGRSKNDIRSAVHGALDMVQLRELTGRFPKQLSGGQQQRVALARAIVFRPPVLLMDEPLGALDRQLRKEVQYELKRIQRMLGLTVVYVTHDQEEALFLSDTIAIMNRGRIVQTGSPRRLYEHPGSRFVAQFLGESNFLPGTVVSASAGEAAVALADGTTVRGTPIGRCDRDAAVDILIRPEKLDCLDPGTEASGQANRIEGTIEMVNFLGGQQEYAVTTVGGRLAARFYPRVASATRSVGSTVTLAFSPGDCMVFSRSDA
jgi:spermidine/putrescine ABC transporter ATP-binding subunit